MYIGFKKSKKVGGPSQNSNIMANKEKKKTKNEKEKGFFVTHVISQV